MSATASLRKARFVNRTSLLKPRFVNQQCEKCAKHKLTIARLRQAYAHLQAALELADSRRRPRRS